MKVSFNIKSAFTGAALGVALSGFLVSSLPMMQAACALAALSLCLEENNKSTNKHSGKILLASAAIVGCLLYGLNQESIGIEPGAEQLSSEAGVQQKIKAV